MSIRSFQFSENEEDGGGGGGLAFSSRGFIPLDPIFFYHDC
jgi:hypothetical protein